MKFFLLKNPIHYLSYIQFQESIRKKRSECVLFLEHPKTITSGTNAEEKNLLFSRELLESHDISLFSINRGGDFTAHEPGQLVIYPHIDLKLRNLKLTDFTKLLKLVTSKSILEVWDLKLIDKPQSPGLYLEENPNKKLVSTGIYFKSFFTSFGLAINCSNSLETFQFINPCGGNSKDIVSIHSLGLDISLVPKFIKLFQTEFLKELHDFDSDLKLIPS
ncbi:MAG: lipoyl(octanoyl) transferase LipB [Leptospiraceae bacterium]|nr:lipoyl(octanoyl) transferase LipB [Leptospiraceae bacterium]